MSEEGSAAIERSLPSSSSSSFSSDDDEDNEKEKVPRPSRVRRNAMEMASVDFTPSWAKPQTEDLSLQRLIIAAGEA
ncbi:unnamed protein product [Effrenium voratum]|nr:unnamed protein product [Effrenium voratum]